MKFSSGTGQSERNGTIFVALVNGARELLLVYFTKNHSSVFKRYTVNV